jgi:hypothetical protein
MPLTTIASASVRRATANLICYKPEGTAIVLTSEKIGEESLMFLGKRMRLQD